MTTKPNNTTGELIEELSGYQSHCMNTGQEQVADLVGRAITALESTQAKLAASEAVREVTLTGKQVFDVLEFVMPDGMEDATIGIVVTMSKEET